MVEGEGRLPEIIGKVGSKEGDLGPFDDRLA